MTTESKLDALIEALGFDVEETPHYFDNVNNSLGYDTEMSKIEPVLHWIEYKLTKREQPSLPGGPMDPNVNPSPWSSEYTPGPPSIFQQRDMTVEEVKKAYSGAGARPKDYSGAGASPGVFTNGKGWSE